MTSKTTREGTQTIEAVAYDYNLQNRLARVATTPYVENVAQTPEVTEYAYNPDGIRISKTVDGTYLTKYLIDPANHTGYAQVLQETRYDVTTPESRIPLSRTDYVIGDDVISQTRSTYSAGTWMAGQTQYLLYDGHGSTRQLLNHTLLDLLPAGSPDGTGETPQIADTYSFDGYGVMLDSTDGADAASSAAANGTSLLYCGEQYDSQADQYYLRARCYNPMNGLFNRMDDYAGNLQDPQSLHKYLYCHANPVNATDPTGRSLLLNISKSIAIMGLITAVTLSTIGAIFDIARGDASAWEIARNAILTFAATFTSCVCPIFMILMLAVGTASILSMIASGEMNKSSWIELGTFIVVSLALLLIFRSAGLLARAGGASAAGGHHSLIPKGGTGRLSLSGFFKNQWGRFVPESIRECGANLVRKGATQTEYLLWHFKVDPNFYGAKGWKPPAGASKYGVLSRLWHGSPGWLQNTAIPCIHQWCFIHYWCD